MTIAQTQEYSQTQELPSRRTPTQISASLGRSSVRKRNKERSLLVLEKCPPNQRRPPTTNITSPRLEDEKIIQPKSHRKNGKNKVSEQAFPGPKERRSRRETHYRPLQIKQKYKIGDIQNANNESSPAATAQRMFDSSAGLERRVLARSSFTKKKRPFLGLKYRGQH